MAGGPYAPKTAGIGGVPTVQTDIPISAVFLLLFIIGAIAHMSILRRNLVRNHIFRISGMIFGYCMARNVTCIMRIVWATHPTNIPISIAANIFSNAGVFIAFLVNLIFAQRLFTAACPRIGNSALFGGAFKGLYVLVVLTLAASIAAVVQSVYTLSPYIHHVDRVVQLTASVIVFLIAALPLPLIVAASLGAKRTPPRGFGSGSWSAKVAVLLLTSLLALTVAGFRLGTTWMSPRPREDPYWFDAKWCYYFFNFVFDVAIIYTFLLARVDKRFHVLGPKDAMEDGFDMEKVRAKEERGRYSEGSSD